MGESSGGQGRGEGWEGLGILSPPHSPLPPAGEKPFQCKLCPQRSRDYSAMIKHLRTHGGAAPYRCTLCCQFCPSLAAMQKHMKGHCPEELPSDWTIETTYLYSSSTSSS